MEIKKIIYNAKTRQQFSNPYGHIKHSELLKLAGVKTFTEYEIKYLGNRCIKVIPKEEKI